MQNRIEYYRTYNRTVRRIRRGLKPLKKSEIKPSIDNLWHRAGKPHPTLGKKRPDAKERMLKNNPNWKGDNVGKVGVHTWIRKRLFRPKLCEMCKQVPPYDLANVTGKYTRDFENWKYLCRSCHVKSDGRLDRLNSR